MKNIVEIKDLIEILKDVETKNSFTKEALDFFIADLSASQLGNLDLELFINLLIEQIEMTYEK